MPETLFNLKIFKGIEKSVVEEIILNSDEKSFKTGEIIILEGAPSNGEGYIIKSGSVKISIGGQKVAELQAGDIVGEIALLNEENRTATVTALEDTEVIVLTLDSLVEMINHDDNSINREIIRRIEENLENS
ncbi:MAG: cyclic nucleotide-binding domain-containing protein [Candidatus Gracilibacteria bacterium]|nr:cyclic nucleotide-binding domain-containing protein [Candidatus Gracilibacteria bacterium]